MLPVQGRNVEIPYLEESKTEVQEESCETDADDKEEKKMIFQRTGRTGFPR